MVRKDLEPLERWWNMQGVPRVPESDFREFEWSYMVETGRNVSRYDRPQRPSGLPWPVKICLRGSMNYTEAVKEIYEAALRHPAPWGAGAAWRDLLRRLSEGHYGFFFDEVDSAPLDVILLLRELNDHGKAGLVLVGTENLARLIEHRKLESLRSRILHHWSIGNLSVEETRDYLVGWGQRLADAVFAATSGNFRLIAKLAENVENLQDAWGEKKITRELILEAGIGVPGLTLTGPAWKIQAEVSSKPSGRGRPQRDGGAPVNAWAGAVASIRADAEAMNQARRTEDAVAAEKQVG